MFHRVCAMWAIDMYFCQGRVYIEKLFVLDMRLTRVTIQVARPDQGVSDGRVSLKAPRDYHPISLEDAFVLHY